MDKLRVRVLLLAAMLPAVATQGRAAEAGAGTDEAGVATVTVTGERGHRTGTAEDGYRVSDVVMGPLGPRAVADLPYAVDTVPRELMENQQVTTAADLIKYLPSAQIEYRGGSEYGRAQSRGFQADLLGNTRIDGFAVQSHIPQPIELTDHLEVVNGLASPLYGPMNPAGVFNYVLKRPTDKRFASAGLSYQSDGNAIVRADTGGRVLDGKLGYRLNVAHGDGDTYVSSSHVRREVLGFAGDARLTPGTVLELNAAHYTYDQAGLPGSFGVASNPQSRLPDAPDPTRTGYANEWATSETSIDYYGIKLTQDLPRDWTLTGGLMRQDATRVMHSAANTLSVDGQRYYVSGSQSFLHAETWSNQAYLNGKARTFGLEHEVSAGTNGYYAPSYSAYNSGALTLRNAGSASTPCGTVSAATCAASVASGWKEDGGFYRTGAYTRYQSATLGDTLHLTEQWAVQGTVANGWIETRSAAGVTSTIDDALSYSFGPVFKPASNQTLYGSYAKSVLPGEQIPTGYANAGDFLSPYAAKQMELGYKIGLGGVDLGLTGFRITRPTTYGLGSEYAVRGQQRNQGLELRSVGKLTDSLTIFGGVTYIASRVTGTGSALTDGKQAVGVPEWQANLLAEYTLPRSLLPDTVASLNLHHTGRKAANSYNTAWADPYQTVDIGLRYAGEVADTGFQASLLLTNVFDTNYWASVFPGNITGSTSSAGSTAYMGEPRTLKASVGVKF